VVSGLRPQRCGERRPRLLFLAYLFPPVASIACVRTWNIAKYLVRCGWEVTVATPQPSLWRQRGDVQATETACREAGVRRLLTGHGWRCLAPDRLHCWNRGLGWLAGGVCRRVARRFGIAEAIGWNRAVLRACAGLTPDDVDVILASGSPFSSFTLARVLAERLGRPYVLDYRDPWTGNLHATRPDRARDVRQEARLLRQAAAITIVSRAWAQVLAQRYGVGSKLQVVTNGYDPEELARVEPHGFGHFAIVYAGTFYPPKRVISPVMAALQRLKASLGGGGGEWRFHYYGDGGEHVRGEARRFDVLERVVIHGQVPRAEALAAVRGAGVTVVITTVAEKGTLADRGMVTGKLYEALGLGTPILLIAPSDSDAVEVVASAPVHGSFCGVDVEGIAAFLRSAVEGKLPCSAGAAPARYAWPALAGQWDALLRACVPGLASVAVAQCGD
jgi:glycosyltransferase involved in cell wall biosynthesis